MVLGWWCGMGVGHPENHQVSMLLGWRAVKQTGRSNLNINQAQNKRIYKHPTTNSKLYPLMAPLLIFVCILENS